MRSLREKPRVTVAKLLAVILVFVAGIAFAGVVSEDEPEVPPGTAAALTRAERAAETRSGRLVEASERAQLLEKRLRASGSRNRRLRQARSRARRQVRKLEK
jgi:hypothetical protein